MGVPGLFLVRAGPAPRAGAGKFLRAGARTRAGAGPTFFDRAAGQGRAGAKKLYFQHLDLYIILYCLQRDGWGV